MKLIVINALSALRGGGQTYLINILLNIINSDIKVIFIVNSHNKNVFINYSSLNVSFYEAKWASKSIFHRFIWEILCLPFVLNNWRTNVYFAPGGIMLTKMPSGCISATALQNMLPFDARERQRFPLFSYVRFKSWLQRYIFLTSYKFADKVVFISEYSRAVIKQYLPTIEDKSIVIPHGLNSGFFVPTLPYNLPPKLKENPFYLYVSILDVYKAQKEVILSWQLLAKQHFPFPLVLVGPKYNQYGEEVLELIKELELSEHVYYLGIVSYEQLPALYHASRALVFASSCECCPNILLEKLAAGKPLFCSNIQPMPEFAGDAVVYFDPYTPSDLCEKILVLEKDQSLMSELGKRAVKQAALFDWKSTVNATFNFLLK